MKLLNNTKLPDETFIPLLISAGRSVGAKTSGVVVQVNRSKYYISGMAYESWKVRWKPSKRWLWTNGGAFRISFPLDKNGDPLDVAQRFFHVAQHEWGHIRDYQHGGRNTIQFSYRIGGRRKAHDKRPEELRAENYIYDSEEKRGKNWQDELILNFAIAIENITQKEREQ